MNNNIAERKASNGLLSNSEHTPSDAGHGQTDNLLVAYGAPRTRPLRELLVDEKQEPLVGKAMGKAPLFAQRSDTEFIFALNEAFKDEFEYLKSADQITVEKGSNHVLGRYGPGGDRSPSELLFGGFYSEVDRTIVGILAMKWILADDYETFTKHQNQFVRLKQESFTKMRDVFIEAFQNSRGSYMLIVSMIVNDLGKNSALREEIRDEDPRWDVMNHDEVIYRAAELGKLSLILEFGTSDRQRLMKGIQFGGMLNLGQLAQAENVPGNLQGIAELMKDDENAFPMKFCEIVLDVAGAGGHVDSRGANAWISPVDEAYTHSRECVLSVIRGDRTIREAYDGVLDHRAELLRSKGWKKLSVQNPQERSLLRLITMARAANKDAAQAVEDAVNSVGAHQIGKTVKDFFGRPIDNMRDALLNALMVDGTDDGIAIIPYYGPGVLAEAMRVSKGASPEVGARAMAAVFRFFARIFIGTRPVSGKGGHVVECDISFIQEVVRSPTFLENPFVLDDVEYPTKEPYSQDIQALMLQVYNVRRLERRRTGSRDKMD